MQSAAPGVTGEGPAASVRPDRSGFAELRLGNADSELWMHHSGALYWPAERMMIVSDLHLEKGSSFARRGVLLPPYDTVTTLTRLEEICALLRPRTVLALGDSFHDSEASGRLADRDRQTLSGMMRGRDWLWLLGNHDPAPPRDLGGETLEIWTRDGLTFRHEPLPNVSPGEVAGHLHPAAAVRRRGRLVRRRCFVSDGSRLVMPAFGAYAGGLDITHAAFAGIFANGKTAWLMGRDRLYPVTERRERMRAFGPNL